MKIDRSKVKKGTSEVPEDCSKIISFLKTCSDEELLNQLKQINVWYFGKCELYHWIDILDRFDTILATVAKPLDGRQWVFQFDVLGEILGKEKGAQKQCLIFQILKFTALLIEHSYARHLYNSIEHLISLLDCADGNIILAVLNLIYVFSKRSNYLSRLPSERKKLMQDKLVDLAQTWGGSEAGCALEQCCLEDVPAGAGNVYFEYYLPDAHVYDNDKSNKLTSNRFCIDLKNVHQMASNVGFIMENILKTKKIPNSVQMLFYHRLRLAHAMVNHEKRLQFVQARLQALSILVYSNATVHVNTLVYDALIEEIVNTLKVNDVSYKLSEVKASCLKTLTAVIHLDRNPRLQSIIDATGATSYHGFLPSLVRQCILHMTDSVYEPFPQQLATSLFSFLYHLASYESGCEALVASGLMESLLKVVLWPGKDDHITFVTRAVRVIDLITNLDMAAFQTHNGLNALVTRLESEVKLCSEFHGPVLSSELTFTSSSEMSISEQGDSDHAQETYTSPLNHVESVLPLERESPSYMANKNQSTDVEMIDEGVKSKSTPQLQCLPQRAALLKSILNFLKKAIPDPAFADYTRSLMDENLQNALKLIISNAEYYGALLFLLATDVITVFIFHEPSLLSSLQDSGLTWVVLKALIIKDVPATRENLASLPNTLSALCLNTRGLEAFVNCKPFERLFQILISPEYLPAMKRRRSSDPTGDTAMHLGSAMDELMRHQPTLKTDAMKAIIKLLEKLCEMGHDPNIIAFHPTDKIKSVRALQRDTEVSTSASAEDPISDDDEEEYRALLIRKSDQKTPNHDFCKASQKDEKAFVPLLDYVLNVTKFLDNILSNNGTDDHCIEFVQLNGLKPLYGLLNMSNFPLEFPLMPACQSIAPVCKSIAMLAQESKVFKEGLTQLEALLDNLDSYYSSASVTGSALLKELSNADDPLQALYDARKTPLVHLMSTVHAFVNTFVFISRGALSDVRSMSIQQWGSELGTNVVQKLCKLYTRLVWESSILLTLCTPNTSAGEEDLSFAEDDLKKLNIKDYSLKDGDSTEVALKKDVNYLTLLKWLLTSSSHLGRALAELFGLLVHQCVGSQGQRLRRHPHNSNQPTAPSLPAQQIASRLTKLLVQGLNWKCPEEIPVPRLRLTFYICSVGFATPMLFDNSKNPYHLMLQQFENGGGLNALFERFQWMMKEFLSNRTEEDIKNAVGIREFLEGWLDLISRMVNTKYVFESTHALPTTSTMPGFIPFDTVSYLARIHKFAFESIMLLWRNKILQHPDSHTIADRMLNILSHLINGEKELKQKLMQQEKHRDKKDKHGLLSEIQKTPAPTTFHTQQESVNEAYLQQLVDMGFSQQHARNALIRTGNNLESATDHLLSVPVRVLHTGHGSASGMDVDLSEEDMMIRAIAMSLGQGMAQEIPMEDDKSTKETKKESSADEKLSPVSIEQLEDFSEAITNSSHDIVTGCFEMVHSIPTAVHTVCDLLLAMARRTGASLYQNMLNDIISDITSSARSIQERIRDANESQDLNSIETVVKNMCEGDESVTLTTRLHLYLLMFQDIENTCASVLQKRGCVVDLIDLLENTTKLLKHCNNLCTGKERETEVPTPNFLAPLLLIFDHYERAALFWERQKHQECSHTWKWFDDRSGRWCNYSISNNTSIDTAYHAGESTVRFSAGRRRYMVFFRTLVQVNEDTGNRRPIMLNVLQGSTTEPAESSGNKAADHRNVESGKELELRKLSKTSMKAIKRKLETGKDKMDVDKKDSDHKYEEVVGLLQFQKELVIESAVELLGFPVNSTTLNAVIRLSFRLTRDFSISRYFVELHGIENLLNLKENSGFPGVMPLITLLLRHIVEDQETLKLAVERAVAVAGNKGVPNLSCGVGQNSLGAKELHYLLRALGSIACRDSKLYKETICKVFRLALPSARRGQLEEVIPPNAAQIVKIPLELKTLGLSGIVVAHKEMEKLVHLLLKTLIERHFHEAEVQKTKEKSTGANTTSNVNKKTEKKKLDAKYTTPQATLVRRLTGEHIDEDEMAAVNSLMNNEVEVSAVCPSTEKADQPLLSQTIILLLLTELAKSYAAVACLIVDYVVENNKCFQGSLLAFIFDNLLPHVNNKEKVEKPDTNSKESKPSTVSTLARSLLSVLGAYWHNSDILNTFVTELKSALTRALQLPECKIKHQRLQALFNLITSMIDFAAPTSFSSHPPLQNSSFIKMLIKRGLVSDLARCTHSLDLSSHHLVSTINVMLKPLEKLSNLANSQSLQGTSKVEKNPKQIPSTSDNIQESDNPMTDTQEIREDENTLGTQPEGDNENAETLQDLDDIVEELLGSNGQPEIFGNTLIATDSADNGVEQRIYIEANPLAGNLSDWNASSESDNNDDDEDDGGMSDNISEGNDEYQGNSEPLLAEVDVNNRAANTVGSLSSNIHDTNADNTDQINEQDVDAGGDTLTATFDIITDQEADIETDMEQRYIMRTVEEPDTMLGGEDDEDDDDDGEDETDDEDGNDEDDDGSEMDADDTIAGTDDAILFGDDEGVEESANPFAGLDDHSGTLELSLPRRPYAIHMTHLSEENTAGPSSLSQSSLLNHPLLLRNNEHATPQGSNQTVARGRGNRRDRGFARQGNTIHIHGGPVFPGSTRILIGEGDIRSAGNRNSDSTAFLAGDDLLFNIFDETNSGLLNSIPNALSRWTIESRLLDGSSVHHCVNLLKPEIVSHLEKLQKEELKEKLDEEKKKKEETEKKVPQKKKESNPITTNNTTVSTETPVVADAENNLSVCIDYSTPSGTCTTTTTVTSSAPPNPSENNVLTNQTSEAMDTSADNEASQQVTSSQLVPFNTRVRVLTARVWTPPVDVQQDTPLRYITPFNPLPEVVPNAPQRDPVTIVTSAVGERLNASFSISNTPQTIQTPMDAPRLSHMRTDAAAALTGDLGFPVITDVNTPYSDLPSMSSILATPSDIPSILHLRSNLQFSAGASPHGTTPRIPPHLTRSNVPSPLTRVQNTQMTEGTLFSNSNRPSSTDPEQMVDSNFPVSAPAPSALAADLAAAIVSQLVTSSPSPVITTASQTINVTSVQTHPGLSVTTMHATESSVITTSTTNTNSERNESTDQDNSTTRATAEATTTTTTSSTPTDTPAAAAAAATLAEPGPGPSGVLRAAEQIQRELESMGIPEGVDPSFLAALPESIREEVLREQFGIRLRSSRDALSQGAGASTDLNAKPQEVSPEFLAALPPEVQQEVLEQQRLEQARFTASQQRPDEAVDPAEFVRNLNPALRRQVLADMDDSVLAVLPPELSSEAQGLRREIEQRRLQMQADRNLNRNDFSQLLRRSDLAYSGNGFQFARLFPRGPMSSWRVTDGPISGSMNNKKIGRQLLDPESLTCLLVLLFLNDSSLNASRLHRIFRNLSYHNSTKRWIILALISILRRTSSFQQESNTSLKSQIEQSSVKPRNKKLKQIDSLLCEEINPNPLQHNQWLSRTLNLAFGGCVNIFQLQNVGRRSTDFFVTVHQQASLDVCKQTLEALSFLAKNFPASFAPLAEKVKIQTYLGEPGPSRNKEFTVVDQQNEFWDILVRLNSSTSGLKGKAPLKGLREFPKDSSQSTSFVTSPLGQILSMLSHPVVKQSTMLTDKLLRLLAVISMSLPERPKTLQAQAVDTAHSDSNAQPHETSASIPTVTFADTDNIFPSGEQSVLHHVSDEERDHNAADAATVCSETTSVTSSMFVEAPEGADNRIMLPSDVRSPQTGSIISAVSDVTVAHSGYSGITSEQIYEEHDDVVMDVDTTSQPISDLSSIDNRSDNRSSPTSSVVQMSPAKEPPILIGHLRMAVNVLTTGTCSDEGLEDATTLLLQLSRTEPLTRDCILELLLEGAQETANMLRDEIKSLLLELKDHNAVHSNTKSTEQQGKPSKQSVPVIVIPPSSRSQPWRGRGGRNASQARRMFGFASNQQSRRTTSKPVIYDLHLPTMAVLTAKRCSQSLFLRVLKVILQLRDAAKKNAKKPSSRTGPNAQRSRGIRLIERLHHGGSSLREFVAALEADMEAMYEMIDRFGASAVHRTSANQVSRGEDLEPSGSDQSGERAANASGSGTTGAPVGGESGNPSDADTTAAGEETSKTQDEPQIPRFPRLSTQLSLDDLWDVLGETLTELAETSDTNAVLVLQPAVEAFFLVHGSDKDEEKPKDSPDVSLSQQTSLDIPPSPGPISPGISSSSGRLSSISSMYTHLPPDTQKFLRFAETHRTVLNQILRQSNSPLSDGPFAVLVHHTRLLDFDVKRRYFRQELEKEDKGHRREDMAVNIRRDHVFEDSYRELHRRTPEELKNRLYIVFDGEEGQDAGGLLREWYGIMAREMFNPNYALFTVSQGEKATYLPNRNSHCNPNHLSYFKFAGRIVAKAIYDNKLLDCYFTRSFYKHILGKPVHYTDMEAEDYGFYQGLVYLLEHHIDELGYELTFSLEMPVFGLNEIHDLKANGRNIPVTEETKREYVKYVCQEKMTGSIRQQIDSFLEGFYEIIPRRLISIFDEQELELLVAGLPTIDIEDLKANTEYHKYTENSLQIQWFWRALRSFEQADRAKFLQFVTGTSKVPLQGFATLEGMNGVQKFQIHRDDRSTDRLPCAHTCFNQLDLPAYETYDKLHSQLLKAIQECPEGFGLA